MKPEWIYGVGGYSNIHHDCGRFGECVFETRHTMANSKDIEVEAALARNDIAYVEIADLKAGTVETLWRTG